jgi:hypothetical protein
MDRPEGAVTATEILVETIENIDSRGISKVIVLCFDSKGNPVGWLSNIGDRTQRLGLLEFGKYNMMQDEE